MGEKILTPWVPFGREVRRLRLKAGLSLAEAARSLTITSGMLSKVERATRATKKDTAVELDRIFGTEGALLRRWSEATSHAADPEWFRQVLRSEEKATEIRTWGLALVPGFLQVEPYARAVFRSGRPLDRPDEIEHLVAGRMERFKTHTRENGPTLWVVLDESVLRRVVGSADVMTAQLQHLQGLGEAGTIRLQILPSATVDSPGSSGPFRLLTVPDGTTLLYAESSGGGSIYDALPEVRRHIALFGELQARALTPGDSLGLIREVLHA
jgi:transcriptional regulator with XRE-family HTH domain